MQLAHHISPRKDRKQFARITISGAWIIILPSRWHGTLLSADKWRNNAPHLHYGLEPFGLCKH